MYCGSTCNSYPERFPRSGGKHLVAMITSFFTCKRPMPYIGQTLESYFDLYDEQPIVFEQPGTEPYLNRTRVIRQETNADGLISNWVAMVQWLEKHTFDDTYMLCEDDIVFRQRITLPSGSYGYLSPYCSLVNAPKGETGWVKPDMRSGQCGALCIVLSRRSLEDIVCQLHRFLALTSGLHLDTAIGRFFESQTNLVHVPTMVLHIGDVSTRETNNPMASLPRFESARQPAL